MKKRLKKAFKKAGKDFRKVSLMGFPAAATAAVLANAGNYKAAFSVGAFAFAWYDFFQGVAYFLDDWSSG